MDALAEERQACRADIAKAQRDTPRGALHLAKMAARFAYRFETDTLQFYKDDGEMVARAFVRVDEWVRAAAGAFYSFGDDCVPVNTHALEAILRAALDETATPRWRDLGGCAAEIALDYASAVRGALVLRMMGFDKSAGGPHSAAPEDYRVLANAIHPHLHAVNDDTLARRVEAMLSSSTEDAPWFEREAPTVGEWAELEGRLDRLRARVRSGLRKNPNGYTARDLRDESADLGEGMSAGTFSKIAKSADGVRPSKRGEQHRKFRDAEIRALADAAESMGYPKTAKAWRALVR